MFFKSLRGCGTCRALQVGEKYNLHIPRSASYTAARNDLQRMSRKKPWGAVKQATRVGSSLNPNSNLSSGNQSPPRVTLMRATSLPTETNELPRQSMDVSPQSPTLETHERSASDMKAAALRIGHNVRQVWATPRRIYPKVPLCEVLGQLRVYTVMRCVAGWQRNLVQHAALKTGKMGYILKQASMFGACCPVPSSQGRVCSGPMQQPPHLPSCAVQALAAARPDKRSRYIATWRHKGTEQARAQFAAESLALAEESLALQEESFRMASEKASRGHHGMLDVCGPCPDAPLACS